MANYTAQDVQRLRQSTGAGMMDAKNALVENDGDFDRAMQWLREKGLASSAKRSERENAEGAVALVKDGPVAAVVELKCETDFVAKSQDFTSLVDELAALVVSKGTEAINERAGEVDDLKIRLKENIELGRVERVEGDPNSIVETYLHIQSDRGKNAVIVEAEGIDASVAHDIAVHIAFARPDFLSRDEVPQEEIDRERATYEAIARNEGKPEAAMPKIVEGRMNGFFKERCLLEQSWVKDEKQSIGQLLGGGRIVRFVQVEVGR